MSNYVQAVTAMQSFFNTGWAGATPIRWGADDPSEPANGINWVRFGIRHNDGLQSTMGSPGSNRFRHIGIITAQVFTPEGSYGVDARALASDMLELYQGKEDSGIYYYNVRADEVGNDGFGWYQINVVIEFRYDNIT